MKTFYRGNSLGKVKAPALKACNELGFYDMSGNYTELCADLTYDDCLFFREQALQFKIFRELTSDYFQQMWDARGGAYGGCWNSDKSDCKVTSHVPDPEKYSIYDGRYYTIRLVYSRPD